MSSKLYLQKNGEFRVTNVTDLSYLYFPIANHFGMKSAITPNLSGDAKVNQDSFILLPTSAEDLHASLLGRNVFFRVNDQYTWSINGNTAYQILNKDDVTLDATFLSHTITKTNQDLQCIIDSFVPYDNHFQELHKITFTNTTKEPMNVKPVISIPIYGRSADNLRDHRHVSSLFNSVTIHKNGMINKPTLSFDENGHKLNNKLYGVFISESFTVSKYWPVMEEFIGEGGSMLDPIAVKETCENNYQIGDTINGYEMTGAFEHQEVTLQPNQSISFVISIFMVEDGPIDEQLTHVNVELFEQLKIMTIQKWKQELSTLDISFGNDVFDGWMKWTSVQPILRRIYGCSFLPHHDYGRGGKGWRDLWQDCLALIIMDPVEVRDLLFNNFIGVRIDGSNATIIGDKPGVFLADRNSITRVWMDHGSWPFLTTKLYIDKSGDYEFLLMEQHYFSDKYTHYTKQVSKNNEAKQNLLHTASGDVYKGTILEHLLLQNVIPFFNVGEHNNIRLEDADWNDGLDMAHNRGESVAFTSLYGNNLVELNNVLLQLETKGIKEISILKEITILFEDIDYNSIAEKNALLQRYFDTVAKGISGEKVTLDTKSIATILLKLGLVLQQQVRTNEWLEGTHGSWFNGYYDDDSNPIDDANNGDITLTGQVFAIFGGSATDDQIEQVIQSVDNHLYDPEIGGYKLNTNFNEIKTNMGRLFGFAYGHKENGAMFSHMAVMYANALYKRGYAHAGNKVIESIFNHCINIDKSKIYPGIPEYIDPKGRGMYHYLTGSASWLILTEVTEVFGIKGNLGHVVLEPKLLKHQFNSEGFASIKTLIKNKLVEIIYINQNNLDYGEYVIETVMDTNQELDVKRTTFGVELLSDIQTTKVYVHLTQKQ